MPFFRAHGHRKAPRREPWLFSEETRRKIENVINLRY
jgi:alpha-glucosidase (family GH31 glycosyl hydrolase)